jgi:hypothetical protein
MREVASIHELPRKLILGNSDARKGISEGDLIPFKKMKPSDGSFSYTHRWDPPPTRVVDGGSVTVVQAV